MSRQIIMVRSRDIYDKSISFMQCIVDPVYFDRTFSVNAILDDDRLRIADQFLSKSARTDLKKN